MIYCVEDDESIRELIVYTLNASGLKAKGFEESGPFWNALNEEIPDLVLLDIMLPGEDGIAILRKLRSASATADLPIIMATAKGTEYDKVRGLDMGADDYLAKPFGMMEMVSRVKALLRRSKPKTASAILTVGPVLIDQSRHTVTAEGKEIILTLKEYELLKMFMENPGMVITREQLLIHVWGTDYVGETRTVDVHIGTLRTKLGENGDIIKTVRGVGYKLEARHE